MNALHRSFKELNGIGKIMQQIMTPADFNPDNRQIFLVILDILFDPKIFLQSRFVILLPEGSLKLKSKEAVYVSVNTLKDSCLTLSLVID